MNDTAAGLRPTRAVARSTRAMVASPHALATAAGVDVLRRGGNAVDAAIATNAVLAVVYPASCGLGGDAFWIVHEPFWKRTVSYNASGRTPRAASLDRLPHGKLPERGALSVTVPARCARGRTSRANTAGSVWTSCSRRRSTSRASGSRSRTSSRTTSRSTNRCCAKIPKRRASFSARACRAPATYSAAPTLPKRSAAIRHGGADAFYTGRIAERIVATLRRGGSAMTLDDLAEHRTELDDAAAHPMERRRAA